MTTVNPRINVTLDKDTLGILGDIAQATHKSVASVAKELILQALELDEDAYWVKVSEERIAENKGKPLLSQEDVFKKLL